MLKLMYAIYVTRKNKNCLTYLKCLLESEENTSSKIKELEEETENVWSYDDTKFYPKLKYRNVHSQLVLCYLYGAQATIIDNVAFVKINQNLSQENQEIPAKYFKGK